MFGACRVAGIGPPIELGGRKFIVYGRRVKDYGTLEAAILAHRGNPFDVLRWMLNRGWREAFGESMFKKIRNGWWNVTYRDLCRWLQTWEGRVYGLWVALRDGADYEFVHASVMRECDRLHRIGRYEPERWWSSIQEAIDAANGDDEVSALDWISRKSEDGEEGIPWPLVFRVLGEEPFNFPPARVEEMTLPQIQNFWCDKEHLRIGMTAVEDGAKRQQRIGREKEARERGVKNLMEGRHWGA